MFHFSECINACSGKFFLFKVFGGIFFEEKSLGAGVGAEFNHVLI